DETGAKAAVETATITESTLEIALREIALRDLAAAACGKTPAAHGADARRADVGLRAADPAEARTTAGTHATATATDLHAPSAAAEMRAAPAAASHLRQRRSCDRQRQRQRGRAHNTEFRHLISPSRGCPPERGQKTAGR